MGCGPPHSCVCLDMARVSGWLAVFAEEFDVGGAVFEGDGVATLDEFADLLDDVRIGEGGDVAGVHAIGNGGEDAAHDFAGAGFGHVGNDVDALGTGDFADHGFDGGDDLVDDLFIGSHAGFDGDVDFGDAAFDFVDDGNDGGFGDFWNAETGGFDLFGAEAVAGDVDDVVDAAEDAVITVGGEHGAIAGEIRPILPFFAFRILAIFFVVLLYEAIGIAPDGLHDAGPGISNADISGGVFAGFDLFSVFVPDGGINSERGGAGGAGLHAVERGLGGAEETAGFGLPPGVDDGCFAFADDFVIPAPDFGLDGFADGGHVLEGVVVFFWFVGAGFAEHANGGGRSVEDIDAETFGDAPGTSGVGELRDAFVENAGGGEGERAVDDVRVAGDPADVGHAPIDVAGLNVLVKL